jgi:hypothetical protein
MGTIIINSFTAPQGVTAEIITSEPDGSNLFTIPGEFFQQYFKDNDGVYHYYPAYFDLPLDSNIVVLTANCSNGCVVVFEQQCQSNFPTPTPTDIPPCYFAAVYSLGGPGNTLTYTDCNGSTTAYTSTAEGLVYLCMPYQTIFNVDFSVNLDSGYDCYSIPETSPLEWVGEVVPTSTPTPTAVTPTPTPTDVAYIYETITYNYSFPTTNANRTVPLRVQAHPNFDGVPASVIGSSTVNFTMTSAIYTNLTIPVTGTSGTIILSAATTTPGVITSIQGLGQNSSLNNTVITATTSELAKCVDILGLGQTHFFTTGNIQELSALTSCQFLGLGLGNFTGDIQYLPNSIERLVFGTYASDGTNTVYGDLANLPTSLQSMQINGYNTVSGNVSSTTSRFQNQSMASSSYFEINGNNTITGNFSDLPNVESINIDNKPPFYGSNIPYFDKLTGNTIGGNLTIKSNQKIIKIGGANTISGDLSSTSASTTPNPITGQGGVLTLNIAGFNTIGGDISLLVPTYYLQILGNNQITGNINTLPSSPNSLEFDIRNIGQTSDFIVTNTGNTLSGNINAFQTWTSLTRLVIGGNNTITGDISSLLPIGATVITLAIFSNNNTINAANFATTDISMLPNAGNYFGWYFISNNTGNGMNSTQVNKLLNYIDVKRTVNSQLGTTLSISGTGHAAPTGTGITAKDSLILKGVNVVTN